MRIQSIPLLCLALVASFTSSASAALLAYEGFAYPDGSNLEDQNGGFGWDGPWDFLQFNSTNVAGSLVYTDTAGKTLLTTGNKLLNVGDSAANNSSQPGRNLTNYFTAVNANRTTWISFLAQRIGEKNDANGATHYQRGANLSLFDTNSIDVPYPGAERLNIGENSSVTNDAWMLRAPNNLGNPGPTISAISTNALDQLSLLVLRLDHVTNTVDNITNDNVYLWVNPLLGTEPSTNSAVTNLLGLKEFSFNRVRLFAGSNNGNPEAQWYLDELRIGETYTDVTPTDTGLIAYEGFDYPAGEDLTGKDGGTGWTSPWGANSGGTTDPAGTVTGDTGVVGSFNYTDSKGNRLVTSGGHAVYSGEPGTSQPFRDFPARGDNNTTTWISFIGVREGPTTNNAATPDNPYPRGCNLAFFDLNTERFAIGNATASPSNAWSILNLGANLANLRQSARPFQQLSFVVVRVDHLDGNDNTYLFLDPDLDREPGTNRAAAVTLGEFDHLFNRARPFAGNTDTANSRPYAQIALDEIRIGKTFAAVTPFIPGGGGAPTISIRRDASGAPEITYTGTLESATTVSGPYQAVQGATSPYKPTGQQAATQFYRAKN